MIALQREPLTASAFAAFGDVIELAGPDPIIINQGFAQRFNDRARVDVSSEGGQVNVSLLLTKPRALPLDVRLMERHPLGTQIFYPLQNRPWTVLVCAEPRDFGSYRAFEAAGRQGVNYVRNAWHHPLLAHEEESRFMIVDRIGPGNNLEEYWLPDSAGVVLTA
jgi:ureidoglycolate lyase